MSDLKGPTPCIDIQKEERFLTSQTPFGMTCLTLLRNTR